MKTLIHLMKKDFSYAMPWVAGTWFALAAGNCLLWMMAGGDGFTSLMVIIARLFPVILIFSTSAKIVQCDPFNGTTGFMGTRPVKPARLLGGKLGAIALFLILPAVVFALLNAAFMRVQISALDYLLLFIEKSLFFSLIAALAVVASMITLRVGAMALVSVAIVVAFFFPFLFVHGNALPGSMEDLNHQASLWLVIKVFLLLAAVAAAMSWVIRRRVWLTVVVFLLGWGCLVSLDKLWKWDFVDDLSKDASMAEIVSGDPALSWLDEPGVGSNNYRNNIQYLKVGRAGRVTGLMDGWTGKLAKFRSEAHFANGEVWQSQGNSDIYPYDDLVSQLLPGLGIEVPMDHPMYLYRKYSESTLFECEKSRLDGLADRRASIRGTGTCQLYQPTVLAVLPAKAGVSAVSGRSRYRIDRLEASGREISVDISIRSVALDSRGDSAGDMAPLEVLIVNPVTKEFTAPGGSGGSSSFGGERVSIHKTMSLDDHRRTAQAPNARTFLDGARLYLIGTRYGGNITLPYEIPSFMLEEKN